MTYTVGLRYSHINKNVFLWRPFFVEAPGQLPSLPSPKSGAHPSTAHTPAVTPTWRFNSNTMQRQKHCRWHLHVMGRSDAGDKLATGVCSEEHVICPRLLLPTLNEITQKLWAIKALAVGHGVSLCSV